MTRASGVWLWLAIGLGAAGLAGCGDDHVARGGAAGVKSAASPGGAKPAKTPARVDLVWPTPNPAFGEGRDIAAFVQPTVSGDPRSGLFGSVRSGGRQFHEGLDLLATTRDKQGESTDPVGAALAGVVRYVSHSSGNSNYGRYVVLEHPQERPAVYTLYAHLREVVPGLQPGQQVAAGERLGTMGRSSSGAPIPKDRAHLHFEIGLRVTDRFAAWYAARGFGSPNPHGIWNGMNLVGLDPLAVFARHQAGGLRSFEDIFSDQPAAVVLQIARAAEPDFVRRYPELLDPAGASDAAMAGGWEITLNATGLPFRWRRLSTAETAGWKPGEVRIQKVDAALLAANRGRKLATQRGGRWVPDEDLSSLLGQLFPR
jgi:murein DD-endopeptidase MepM/ murein hydrolase activator NlpD